MKEDKSGITMRHTSAKMIFVAVAIMLIGSVTASAKNYVSWTGGFHIVIPDNWEQIDYQTVDAFLISNQADNDALNYDAVFAPVTSIPFFNGNYFFVIVDAVGQLSKTQIDSVLGEMGATFGQDIKYFPVANFLSDMKSNAPSYDADKKLVTVINDIVRRDQVTKKMMLMTKFYENGMATFYFYTPDTLFEQSKQVIGDIIQSFSTEDLDAAAGKISLQVADIKEVDDGDKNNDDDSMSPSTWVPFSGVIIVLIVILARRKKKARKEQ
jgi:hypothetical protein